MIIAQGTGLVLGTNELGRDVARALAATDAFARVFTAGTMPVAVRDRHRDIDFLDRSAPRKIAAALGDLSPRCLIVLAVSESPVTPERNRRHDSLVASGIAAGVRIWHDRGGRLERLIVLSSTAVYGLARSSPLLFDDRREGEGEGWPEDGLPDESELDPASTYGRWVRDLREYEALLESVASDLDIGLTLLRSAHIVGGPIASPVNAYLDSVFPVRVLGSDPPVQVIHYDDLVDAILRTCEEDVDGVLNIVARGTVALSRLGALSGRFLFPLPGVVARLAAPDVLGVEPLRARCVADGRRTLQRLGIRPRLTTEEALGG
jgi:nucleoside-diphosphate-sugar epimerase